VGGIDLVFLRFLCELVFVVVGAKILMSSFVISMFLLLLVCMDSVYRRDVLLFEFKSPLILRARSVWGAWVLTACTRDYLLVMFVKRGHLVVERLVALKLLRAA
jgi:hypothetical protein